MHIIAGSYKNRRIKTPKGSVTRPTMGMMREALFNICQQGIEGAHFLDLFAGSGAMGIEALSRGALESTFVDADRESIRCIQDNLKQLNLADQARVLHGDVFIQLKLLERLQKKFDIIYVDPPYENCKEGLQYSKRVLELLDTAPLLKAGGLLFIEGPHPFDLELELKNLTFEKARRMGRATLREYSK
jgi:16S rRNA (guanine966-N2)-methyltransferase